MRARSDSEVTPVRLEIPNVEEKRILAPLTTYKIGGPADFFVEVRSSDALVDAVREARRTKTLYFILGSGANILVTDKGFRGLVIQNCADHIEYIEGQRVRAESGTSITDLIVVCCDHGLSGLEHFAGIPGTVGGALWQNVHFLSPAPAREKTVYIADVVERARILTQEDEVKDVGVDYFQFGYDTSVLHERQDVVLDVTFQLTPKPKDDIQKIINENVSWRAQKHPPLDELPSCGSVFKKIEGVGAGRLIEQSGLKGFRIGGAMVSEQHANFIVNCGDATASDVLAIIAHVQQVVKEKTGYWLELEICVIGEP